MTVRCPSLKAPFQGKLWSSPFKEVPLGTFRKLSLSSLRNTSTCVCVCAVGVLSQALTV